VKTIVFGVAGIVTIWLAAASDLGAGPPTQPITVGEPSLPVTVETSQSVRTDLIVQRAAGAPFHPSIRNPFDYGSRRSPSPPKRTTGLADNVEPSRANAASPMLTLSGIARKGSRHTAVIVSGAQIHLVSEGDAFMGRYTAVEIGSEAVRVRDASGVEFRLTFRETAGRPQSRGQS
jgi:hypothetical protein